jgi:hypothetical protein
MGELAWPESIDPVVQSARFGPEESFWDGAEAAVARGLPDEALRYLATVGLAELVTQTHRMERNAQALCIGDLLLIARVPGSEPRVRGGRTEDADRPGLGDTGPATHGRSVAPMDVATEFSPPRVARIRAS